jgi:hypothetical protein
MGRSTCASVSAFNFDAQPAQLDRLVSLIWRPEGAASSIIGFLIGGIKTGDRSASPLLD